MNKKTRVTLYGIWMCLLFACVLLCCSCGKKGSTVLIGSLDGQETDGTSGDSGEADGADFDNADPGGIQESGGEDVPIRVYVCGAVMNPGVVEIPSGSRAEDALLAAGGFSPEAGKASVNLADWVTDGQMLYIPPEEEAEEQKLQETESASGLVNINTADAAALCTLPGVGESRAADIISYREANGGFESFEDIMKVPGIKTAMYEKIRDKITVK